MLLIPRRGCDFQVAHSSDSARASAAFTCRDPTGPFPAQKSRTLETDIFSRSDIHPRRREWLGSAFVRDPLTVAFCIYAPGVLVAVESRACSGKKFDLKPLRGKRKKKEEKRKREKKRRRANEGDGKKGDGETRGRGLKGVRERGGGGGERGREEREGGREERAAATSGIEYVCT